MTYGEIKSMWIWENKPMDVWENPINYITRGKKSYWWENGREKGRRGKEKFRVGS